MKITFVQNDKEKAESDAAIRAGLSLEKAKGPEASFRPARCRTGEKEPKR